MAQISVTTKPSGSDRSWLEVGTFKLDEFGRKEWLRHSHPTQDRRLKIDRKDSGYGSKTIDWVVLIPDDYPLTLAKITYDRRHPKKVEVLWEPSPVQRDLNREEKIQRAFELAEGNAELTDLLKELLGSA